MAEIRTPIVPQYPRCEADGCTNTNAKEPLFEVVEARPANGRPRTRHEYACADCIKRIKASKGNPMPWPPGAATLINSTHPLAPKVRYPAR